MAARIEERAGARAAIDRLRREIARIEGRPEGSPLDNLPLAGRSAGQALAQTGRVGLSNVSAAFSSPPPCGEGKLYKASDSPPLPLGVARLDKMLGGGLASASLHEVRAESRAAGAAVGFLTALAALLSGSGRSPAVLWIADESGRREAGGLHGPGLLDLGLDPARIVRVAARRPVDALWAFEAGLSCADLVAICEIGGPRSLDLTATRRLALRARASGAAGFLLRIGGPAEASAGETRWRVAPVPSQPLGAFAAGLGRPAWEVELEKSRGGPTGRMILEWSPHERRFEERAAAAHPVPVAAAPAHRPSSAGA